MGFYGNITNTSKTQFQFDKTFPNRTVMDRFIDNDGIFIGRFVLIEYDKQLTADWCSTAYLISDEYGVKHFFGAPDLSADSEFLYGDGNITLGKYIRVPGSFNDVNGNRVVYNLDDPANEKDILFLIVETEGRLVPPNVENKTETSQKDFYNENYNIDLNTYGGGRGYDSTVWQKVFKDGIERYVMVAELNSEVPSFAVSADAPTLSPVAPHFDADSTNVFYRVHWQPSWGLRVKSASPDISVRPINDAGQTVVGSFVSMSEKLDSKLPSDETTIWTRSAYDASTGKQINYYLNKINY